MSANAPLLNVCGLGRSLKAPPLKKRTWGPSCCCCCRVGVRGQGSELLATHHLKHLNSRSAKDLQGRRLSRNKLYYTAGISSSANMADRTERCCKKSQGSAVAPLGGALLGSTSGRRQEVVPRPLTHQLVGRLSLQDGGLQALWVTVATR